MFAIRTAEPSAFDRAGFSVFEPGGLTDDPARALVAEGPGVVIAPEGALS